MKKITAVVMCVLLLACVMAFNIFALNFYSDVTPTTSFAVDGQINSGEYFWSTSPLDKKVALDNQFYVTVPHIDGQKLTIEYFLGYDEENLYFAVAERTLGFTTTHIIDLVYCTSDGTVKGHMTIEMEFIRDNSISEAYAPTFTSFNVDGKDALYSISDYVTEAKGYYNDDGIRNNNYVEMKLSREAVESFVGEDVVGFGLRVVNQPNGGNHGETVFGDEDSIIYPDGLHTNIGYHFFGLEEGVLENLKLPSEVTDPVDTEPTETVPQQTGNDNSNDANTGDTDEKTNITLENEQKKKGGCSSSVSLFGLPLIACVAVSAVVSKKKK